ncbi:MAG: hypothetical protein WC378_16345, partial [Opitutaceae bacterium]
MIASIIALVCAVFISCDSSKESKSVEYIPSGGTYMEVVAGYGTPEIVYQSGSDDLNSPSTVLASMCDGNESTYHQIGYSSATGSPASIDIMMAVNLSIPLYAADIEVIMLGQLAHSGSSSGKVNYEISIVDSDNVESIVKTGTVGPVPTSVPVTIQRIIRKIRVHFYGTAPASVSPDSSSAIARIYEIYANGEEITVGSGRIALNGRTMRTCKPVSAESALKVFNGIEALDICLVSTSHALASPARVCA